MTALTSIHKFRHSPHVRLRDKGFSLFKIRISVRLSSKRCSVHHVSLTLPLKTDEHIKISHSFTADTWTLCANLAPPSFP